VKFLMLCNARRLNPFEGDAYMIPFFDTSVGKHRWSLITAHSAFLKRAELHPYYDGMESGIIVERKGDILDLPGDFRLDSDKLLGGWSIVYNKNHTHPSVKRVKLSTYIKGFGVWTKDPEGMICKVSEAQNLRDNFPTLIGGMYLREELEGEDFQRLVNQETKRPNIPEMGASPPPTTTEPTRKRRDSKGRPTMVEEPLDKPFDQPAPTVQAEPATNPVAVPPTPIPEATPPPQTPPPPTTPEPPEAELLRLAKAANVSLEQLTKYCFKDKFLKPPQTKITEMSSGKIAALTDYWKKDPEFVKRVLAVQ